MTVDLSDLTSVRSFDNTHGETIQFLAPLTLIVGYNGSGKTTIIECLKYATTGLLPSNSKTGGAFIHDPALCGEREVLAQVKLSFKSTSGAKMVATRSLSLTVKKGTIRTQKTLEGTLLMSRAGERTVISSRVAELDHIMPQYLGVSKAVLEYVIFCHQDESLWPLSDSSTLKKRFDEVFEAQKYTKAIDNIKILRKKQREELEKKRIVAQHEKENKDKGARAEKRSEELSKELDDLRGKAERLEKDRKEAVEQSEIAWTNYSKFDTIVGKLDNKRMESKSLESHVTDLKLHMEEMEDSDEHLQEILDQYEERMKHLKDDSDGFMDHYRGVEREIEKNRKEMGVKQAEVGRYQAQKDAYDRQVDSRTELIKDTARRHVIRGFDLEITDKHVRDIMDRVSRMARDQNRAFEKARQESQEETENAQRVLNETQNGKTALTQGKESARLQMANNDRKIAALQGDLNKIDVDEGDKSMLESSIEDLERRLNKAKTDFDSTSWDAQVSETNTEIRQLEERYVKLNTELIQSTKQAGEAARVQYLEKELKDRQKSLDTMMGAHGSNLSTVVGGGWTPATLEHAYNDVLQHKMSEVHDAENQRDGVNRELELLESKINAIGNDRKRKQREMEEAETKVKSALDGDAEDYLETLSNLQANHDAIGGDAATQEAMESYYRSALNVVDKHGACSLCMRTWKQEKDTNAFKSNLEKKLKQIVDQEVGKEFKQNEEDLGRVKAAHGDYDTWVRLKNTELPALQKEYEEFEKKRVSVLADVDRKDELANDCQASKRDLEAMQKTVSNIVKYQSDIDTFTAQMGESQVMQKSQSDLRSLDRIQEDLELVNEQSRRAKAGLQQLTDARDRARGNITSLELETRDTDSKLSATTYKLREKETLQKQIEELRASSNEQRETVRRIDIDMNELAPKIAQAQETYDEARRRGDQRVRELQQQSAQVSESLQQLKSVDNEINAYIDRGGPQQLANSKHEVEALEQDISKIEQEKMRLTSEIKKIEGQLRSQDATRRSINDNLRYRRGQKELAAIRTEIMELEAQNAEEDKAKWDSEGRKWDGKRSLLTAEQASVIGILQTKDEQLSQLLKDWETDYKDAAEKYRKANIEVETTKHVVDDLAKYSGALDKAIMKFHSLKMEEINRIIEELWKKTYQGTDVDTIVIRSDNESQKGNRSYNYRVCMVKADAEMDMRGRCSAGQKVLASIIIRLALAECFGVNCGIIALDEPTTNLDRDNIRALAESLAEIIRIRRRQSNFQLIVITHDEEFLRMMGVADFVDNYYRVSRDQQMKSIIERQSIGEVMV